MIMYGADTGGGLSQMQGLRFRGLSQAEVMELGRLLKATGTRNAPESAANKDLACR